MSTRKTTWFYSALIAVASLAIGMVIASRLDMAPASMAQARRRAADEQRADLPAPIDAQTFRTIARRQSPMVVSIATTASRRTEEMSDFFGGDDFSAASSATRTRSGSRSSAGRASPRKPSAPAPASSSTRAGLILTNNHVVESATKIRVKLFGEDESASSTRSVVGRDPLTDCALIELVEKPSRPLPEASSATPSRCSPATG